MARNEDLYKHIKCLAPFLFVTTDEEVRFLKWIQDNFTTKPWHQFNVYNPALGLKSLEDYISTWYSMSEDALRIDPNTADPNQTMFRLLTAGEQIDSNTTLDTRKARQYTIFLGCTQTILSGRDPMLTRRLRELANQIHANKFAYKSYVFVGSDLIIPPGFERIFEVASFDLPAAEDLAEILGRIVSTENSSIISRYDTNISRKAVCDAGLGLSHYEFEYACLSNITMHRKLTPDMIRDVKVNSIKKNPLLDLLEPKVSFKDIGGMDRLKKYLIQRKGSWSLEGKSYGLPRFRGILQVGLPGNGKSLSCKAVGKEYGLPTIKFDPAKLFGGTVGTSETNMRRALATMEQLAPCVVWIDEIEKGLAGIQSSSFSDSGTTARVIGTFLNWMQECEKDVILMATANDISNLPPELLRRFDEIFFVGLPGTIQRAEIWNIQIRAKGRDPKNYNIDDLVASSKDRSGSEIENAVNAALFTAFSDKKRDMTTEDMLDAVESKPPLLVTMREQLQSIIDWVGYDKTARDGVRARFANEVEENTTELTVL